MNNYILGELGCIETDMIIWGYIVNNSYSCDDYCKEGIVLRIENVMAKTKRWFPRK